MVRPSWARFLRKVRSQAIPMGSKPLEGSSSTKISGSPSNAVASERRCFIPRENSLTFFGATSNNSTSSSTSSARASGIPAAAAIISKFLMALKEGLYPPDSITAPTCRIGFTRAWYGAPWMSPLPEFGVARESKHLRVVLLPAPFGPRKPVIRPASTLAVRLFTATTSL